MFVEETDHRLIEFNKRLVFQLFSCLAERAFGDFSCGDIKVVKGFEEIIQGGVVG